MPKKHMDSIEGKVHVIESDNPNGEFEAVLVTSDLDRENESINLKAFDPLPESIPIHVNHDIYNVKSLVGRGSPYYDTDAIRVKGFFASTQDAQYVRTLVVEGVLDSMSVGFINAERKKEEGKTVLTKGRMLEGTFTAIPANTAARVLAAKAVEKTDDTEKAVLYVLKESNLDPEQGAEVLSKINEQLATEKDEEAEASEPKAEESAAEAADESAETPEGPKAGDPAAEAADSPAETPVEEEDDLEVRARALAIAAESALL